MKSAKVVVARRMSVEGGVSEKIQPPYVRFGRRPFEEKYPRPIENVTSSSSVVLFLALLDLQSLPSWLSSHLAPRKPFALLLAVSPAPPNPQK